MIFVLQDTGPSFGIKFCEFVVPFYGIVASSNIQFVKRTKSILNGTRNTQDISQLLNIEIN